MQKTFYINYIIHNPINSNLESEPIVITPYNSRIFTNELVYVPFLGIVAGYLHVKSNNTIPNFTWAQVGTIENHKPEKLINLPGITTGAGHHAFLRIYQDGTVSVYLEDATGQNDVGASVMYKSS